MKKVLIVDDDNAILEAMQLALEEESYEVNTVSDGDRAYEVSKSFKPDIILLDYLLSGNSGTEIIEVLKKDNSLKDIPIILLSAHPTAVHIAKESGATDFLAKPFNVEDLLNKILKCLTSKNIK